MAFNNAFIGYDNHATLSATSISGTNISSGFSALSAGNWAAFDFVQFDAGACSLVFDLGAAMPINYIAIAGHTLFSTGADNIVVEVDSASDFSTAVELLTITKDGSAYEGAHRYDTTTAYSQIPNGNAIICARLDAISRRYLRITFDAADVCRIGVVAFGERMLFERGFYNNFQPPRWNEVVDTTNNKSESGVYLGRSIVRSGLDPIQIKVDPVTHTWVDTVWLPFRQHADLYPFIFSWNNSVLADNVLAMQKQWLESKVLNRFWASVGVTIEGVMK